MKILNLYAGIGGNRNLRGNDHDITTVESEQYIADVYQQLYPEDNVIVGDAVEPHVGLHILKQGVSENEKIRNMLNDPEVIGKAANGAIKSQRKMAGLESEENE